MTRKPKRTWTELPVRVCRTLHHCEICEKNINLGQVYRDGGYGRRAHETCVRKENSNKKGASNDAR